jgi:hypothetical protein
MTDPVMQIISREMMERAADEIERLNAVADELTAKNAEIERLRADIAKELRELANNLWEVEYRVRVDEDAKLLLEAARALEGK